ncbi:hypothetical protein [Ruminococcus sp.]|uniref:hypothetical protein n=1 Tax=Ruminococcus sp. TaxID=41978 RepID=UPI0038660587
MDEGYSILMALFAVAILCYAGLMAIFKDYKMLPYRARVSVQPKDEKRYMVQLSKVVALVALAPLLSALVGLWNIFAALIVLIAAAVVFIRLGTKLMRDVE